MNFKRYHVSKNLYFKSLANCSIDATGRLTGNSQFMCYVAKVEANKTYIGEKGYVYAFFDTEPVLGSQSYNSQRVVENARAGITSPINGYVVVRFNTGTTDAMLSEGTTILPYEPYSSEVWHDSHYIRVNGEWHAVASAHKHSGGQWD